MPPSTSQGRAGVAPSLERCPVCNKRVHLLETSDRQFLCHDCWETYELALAEEAAGWRQEQPADVDEELHDPHADTEPEPEGAADQGRLRILAPLYNLLRPHIDT